MPLGGGAAMCVGNLNAPSSASPAVSPASGEYDLAGIVVIIVFLCSLTGVTGGAMIGGLMIITRRIHFSVPIVAAPIFGIVWGLVTGGIGGFPMFVIGGIIGALIAAPFGALGFLFFAAVYETSVRKISSVLGWRKTLIFAVGTLLVTIIVGAFTIFIFGK